MKNILTKLLLFILCLVMLASVCVGFAACDDKDKNNNAGEGPSSLDDDPNAPKLPNKKYNGKFVILGQDPTDYYVEDAKSGDIVEYEMYMRNLAVEETYGVEIVPNELFYADVPGRVSDLIKANDTNSIDLVLNHIVYNSNIVLAGNAVDWNTVPYVDLSDPWWPEFNLDDLTLNDKSYIVVNDLANSSITHTAALFFNKKLVEKFNRGDIYSIVNSGKWTYDEFLRCVEGVYENQNNAPKVEALYGFRGPAFTGNTTFIWGFNNPVFSRNENTGELECSYYSPKISKIAKDLVDLYYKTDGVYYDGADQMAYFVKGQAMFTTGSFLSMMSDLRDMDGWGIVPFPKYNERQSSYYSMLGGGSNALVAPKIGGGEAKLEKLGVIVTELAYRSQRDVRVKLYEKALKGKYADDVSESVMVDKIYDSRIIDFGYIYMGFDGPSFDLQRDIVAKTYDVAGSWGRRKTVYNGILDKVYTAFGLTFEGLA